VGVRIEPFDPKTASREAWARYHVFRRVRHAEEDPEDPLNSDAQEEALMKRDDPEGDDLIRVAVDPATGAYVGVLWFSHFFEASPSYATNGHIAWTGVGVILPHRRRGVGTALLRLLPDLARAYKVTQLFGWAQEEDGKAFLRAVGADIGSYRRENRLDLDLVDWPMVERWAREGAARSPDTILRWFRNRIDDDVIVPYAKVYTEVGNQQPRDRLELGDFIITPDLLREKADRLASFGATWLTVASVEGDGGISGFTEVVYDPEDDYLIGQGLTGVHEADRGRGLGKWLKAAMLLRVRDEFPQVRVVSTWNGTTNAAMLKINDALGFREHRVAEMPQMKVDALEAYLARARASEESLAP